MEENKEKEDVYKSGDKNFSISAGDGQLGERINGLEKILLEKEKRIDIEVGGLKEKMKNIENRVEKVEDRKYDIIKTIILAVVTFFMGYFLNSLKK